MTENRLANVVSPSKEMNSWETLWALRDQTQKTIAETFRKFNARLPSEALEQARKEELLAIQDVEEAVAQYLEAITDAFSVCIRGTYQYPKKLRAAKYPVELFYYRGDIGLLDNACVSIVGARKCTPEGARRAAKLARELSALGHVIISGLAEGIDTAAMTATIKAGGRTVGVIGTPINHSYPKKNAELQEMVATEHLLVSQVPFYRYEHEYWKNRRWYFPQRNETMASLSAATIIVEASETSGTHTQARACMQQGRKLFVLNSCFESGQTWPHLYEEQGAIRVRNTDDILTALGSLSDAGKSLEANGSAGGDAVLPGA